MSRQARAGGARPDAEALDRAAGNPPSFSRRTFVKATSASAFVLLGLGGAGALTKKEALLRPPGGQDEASLVARCNHCGRCTSVCHTHAVGMASIADGLVDARTPVMRFNLGICDFCGDCVKVCPTGALVSDDVKEEKIGLAVINRETCLAFTSDSCNLCHVECPYEAIDLDEQGYPVVVANRCNGCGVCENVCPVLSLRSYIGGERKAIVVGPAGSSGSEEDAR